VTTRYRCSACGNRTRFDVLSTKRSRAYHHFSLGGDLNIEEEEILSLDVELVTCRWCGRSNAIETIEDPSQAEPAAQQS
jgi:hypothetical protein